MEDKSQLLDILKDQVKAALGCTEPIAVAYAVAKAKEVLGEVMESLEIKVDRNVFKNAMGVFIPGTDRKGIKVAAALAIIAGKSEYGLEVLKDITKDDLKKAMYLIEEEIIELSIKKDVKGLFIEVTAYGDENNVKVQVQGKHDQIVLIEKNGKEVLYKEDKPEQKLNTINPIKSFTIADLVDFIDEVGLDKLTVVMEGISMNKTIAQAWAKQKPNLEKNMVTAYENKDFKEYAKLLTIAACDGRMSGFPLPVMSCSGSGNHGIAAILPVVGVGEVKGKSEEMITRAVALSLLVTIYIKSYTGALSPVCGCGIAAGVGASAGITYILGGNMKQIEGCIKNMVGGLAGILCDGGKPGCAFKLSISAGAAVEAALMALNDTFISADDGIVDITAEKSIQNLGRVSTEGMLDTDETILEVMMGKCP